MNPSRPAVLRSPLMRRGRRLRAFTIIEVLVVAVIAALMAAGAVNLFSGGNFERVDAAVRLIQSDLDFARSASLSNPDNPVVMRLAADGSGYHLARVSAPTTPITGPLGPMTMTFGVGRGEAAAGCTVATVSGVTTIQFGPFGGIEDPVPTLRVTLPDTGEQATMLLDPITGDPTVMYENE